MTMANLKNFNWKNGCVHQLLLFVLSLNWTFSSVIASSAKYCFSGQDIFSQAALLNQTCETRATHLAKTFVATDHNEPVQGVQKLKQTSSNYSDLSQYARNCFIFRHLTSAYISEETRIESIHVTFGCDLDNVCKGKEADAVINRVKYKGQYGKLYCCSSDNCNSFDKMTHAPAENRICYNGSSNSSTVDLESCSHPDVYCVRLTMFLKDGKYETFSCDKHDNHRQCDPSKVNGAIRFCDNRTVDGVAQELCCCDGNRCNKPSNPKLLVPEKESADGTTLDASKRKNINPITKPESKGKSNRAITGLVAAVVIVVFAGVIVILFTAYKKGKQRNVMRRDPNVIMQYERLSGSEPDVEDAVIV